MLEKDENKYIENDESDQFGEHQLESPCGSPSIVITDYELSEELLQSVRNYIEAHYTPDVEFSIPMTTVSVCTSPRATASAYKTIAEEFETYDKLCVAEDMIVQEKEYSENEQLTLAFGAEPREPLARKLARSAKSTSSKKESSGMARDDSLGDMLENLDAGFSETLLGLIDRTGKKDSEIYRRAMVDRKLFSKIRKNPDYKPSKSTALAFAFALELDIKQAQDFIRRAGYAISHSSKFDVVVEYFLVHKIYDIFELNEVLYKFDQPLLGGV